jgi:hypothetical protein
MLLHPNYNPGRMRTFITRQACNKEHINIMRLMILKFGLPNDRKIFLDSCRHGYMDIVNMYLGIRKIDNITKCIGLSIALSEDNMDIVKLLLPVTGNFELSWLFYCSCNSNNVNEAILIINIIFNKFPKFIEITKSI